MKEKKKGSKLKTVLIVLLVLVIIGAIASQGEDDTPKVVDNSGAGTVTTEANKNDTANENTPTPEPTIEEKTEFGVGETVELKDVLATLVSVTESSGGDFNKPSDGNVFVLCEFTIENNSSEDLIISSMLSFEAYCDDFSISQSIGGMLAKGDKGQLDGSIAAGKKMNGVIAYEVPTDWKELEIKFTPNVWSGKDITFIATKE